MKILLKRIYDDFSPSDGFRVLADRLWPRGIKKEDARIELWAKELTPSNDLRKWFHAHPENRAEFSTKFLQELSQNKNLEDTLNDLRDHETVTLLTSLKHIDDCHLQVIEKFLTKKLK